MKFKYIFILVCLTLVAGCNNQSSGEEEVSTNSQSIKITEESSSIVPEIVESEPIEPAGPNTSEEEISNLLNEFSILKIDIFNSLDNSGYKLYVKSDNPTPLVLEEYNVNAWNIIDKVYAGINTTDIKELTVFVSAEDIATYHSIRISPETYKTLKNIDFNPETLSEVSDSTIINDKLKSPDVPKNDSDRSDFDRNGTYKPADKMTKQEIEDELQDMINENFGK